VGVGPTSLVMAAGPVFVLAAGPAGFTILPLISGHAVAMATGPATGTTKRREITVPRAGETTVFTDGACLGNPGPGGWAWAVPEGPFRSGPDPATTNQRMEITAALRALQDLSGPVLLISDSTYVVNCFRDRWWQAWIRKGWRNAAGKPVANRDLWEPLIEIALDPRRLVRFDWVKGHSGDPMNDRVDLLANSAATTQQASQGRVFLD